MILDREFYKHLNLPEVIHKGKIYDIKSLPNKPLFLFCDIINSHKSYTGFDILGEVQLKSSNLLAVFPSEHYPSLEIDKIRLPINQLTLRIEDESGEKPQFNESITFSIEITYNFLILKICNITKKYIQTWMKSKTMKTKEIISDLTRCPNV